MFVVANKPKSIAAEAYRTLRTNIQYSSFDTEIQAVVVTSSEPGEGKSTVSGNLAIALAQDGKNVIIVDCDLRKPSIHKKFRVSNQLGLSDVLVANKKIEECLHSVSHNFQVLTSGKIPPNPSEMLGSKAMERLITMLRDNYDYIILDTPPVHAVTDSQILSTKVDGTLLVVRSQQTKKELVVQAKKMLEKVNANIIGTVLTRVANEKEKYYYYYGTEKE